MIYALIGISLLFVLIGFIVTENNARYLLAGYNTMSEEERKKVDIKSYIPHFRRFHIFLGVSFLLLGIIFTTLLSENAGGIFIAVYPVLAYIYFIATSSKYSKGNNMKSYRPAFFILIGSLIFVVGLLLYGHKENKLIFDSEGITFKGSYGETLTPSEIKSIELVAQLPEITMRTNGFSNGDVHKGYFKTESGEIIKMILNADHKPYILVTKSDDKKIYFSAKEVSNEKIFNELKKALPATLFKQ